MIKITSDLKQLFKSEASDLLNEFEKWLLVIEKDPLQSDAISSAFRAIHSIKGNSSYLGIRDINLLSHGLEDLMDELRSKHSSVSQDILNILFQGVDLLRNMCSRVTDDIYQETDISFIMDEISRLKSNKKNSEIPPNDRAVGDFNFDATSDMLDQEIKVGVEKIDNFMTHILELTIEKNTMNYLIEQISRNKGSEWRWSADLKKISSNISRVGDILQSDVMKLRLVTLKTIFERLPRIVRELCGTNLKKIDLVMSGGEIEVDRTIIQSIIDPMIHIIRNSVDHGIESVEKRIEAGKPETGIIRIDAYVVGHNAVIEIADDGKGLDVNLIRERALAQGIISEGALDNMNNDAIMKLIFLPGFSTKTEATTVSGRGVGLDIVKKNITNIGGSVRISSTFGAGTLIKLQIPILMSITDVLIVQASGLRFAFPLASIFKTIKVKKDKIRSMGKRKAIVLENTIIFIRHLAEILKIPNPKLGDFNKGYDMISVVGIYAGEKRIGIIVDDILRRDSILIKPLVRYLTGIREFSGSALLGDGSVVLVIDPAELISGGF